MNFFTHKKFIFVLLIDPGHLPVNSISLYGKFDC